MKTNYFTKIENKYVFNVSLIFWHLFIALSTLAVAVSIAVFLWSIIPTFERKVKKQPYPEEKKLPEPVRVSLNELNLEEAKQEEPLPEPEQAQPAETTPEQPTHEDTNGKTDYEASLNALKGLIPPSKYSWAGSGSWTYPNGERYWTVYKQERYRQWVSTSPGVEEKLKSSYITASAKSYPDKKQILDGFIQVVKLLPEEKRLSALHYLIGNIANNNVTQTVTFCQSIAKVVGKMPNEENILFINQLAVFGKRNLKDGALFIDYISTIIDKFDVTQRTKIIDGLTNSYYGYFGQNFPKQKEATDLFIPLLSQIEGKNHLKALMQYYGLYLTKNHDRDDAIAQIKNERQQKIDEIDNQYKAEQATAMMQYQEERMAKLKSRLKSLMAMGVGILQIVLIATMLVFFSIQRSVRNIEEKISTQNNS